LEEKRITRTSMHHEMRHAVLRLKSKRCIFTLWNPVVTFLFYHFKISPCFFAFICFSRHPHTYTENLTAECSEVFCCWSVLVIIQRYLYRIRPRSESQSHVIIFIFFKFITMYKYTDFATFMRIAFLKNWKKNAPFGRICTIKCVMRCWTKIRKAVYYDCEFHYGLSFFLWFALPLFF
jgi:hypothetical protein